MYKKKIKIRLKNQQQKKQKRPVITNTYMYTEIYYY